MAREGLRGLVWLVVALNAAVQPACERRSDGIVKDWRAELRSKSYRIIRRQMAVSGAPADGSGPLLAEAEPFTKSVATLLETPTRWQYGYEPQPRSTHLWLEGQNGSIEVLVAPKPDMAAREMANYLSSIELVLQPIDRPAIGQARYGSSGILVFLRQNVVVWNRCKGIRPAACDARAAEIDRQLQVALAEQTTR